MVRNNVPKNAKVRKTQEEEVLEMLKRKGFRDLSKSEIQHEPYKTIYKLPECFRKDKKIVRHKA